MFPDKYYNAIFVTEHGSWNRATSIGCRVVVVYLGCDTERADYSKVIGHEVFLDGFILNYNTDNYAGRPTDVEILYDGSMIIADDSSDNIYRVTYDPELVDDTVRSEEICDLPTPQPTERPTDDTPSPIDMTTTNDDGMTTTNDDDIMSTLFTDTISITDQSTLISQDEETTETTDEVVSDNAHGFDTFYFFSMFCAFFVFYITV